MWTALFSRLGGVRWVKRAGVMRDWAGEAGRSRGSDGDPRTYFAAPVSGGVHLRAGALTTLPLLRQRVHTRMWRTPPSTLARTRCRLGSQVREVTLCAWLTLRPNVVPLPQISHCLAMISPCSSPKGMRRYQNPRAISSGWELHHAILVFGGPRGPVCRGAGLGRRPRYRACSSRDGPEAGLC